jgi:hypothetical protein
MRRIARSGAVAAGLAAAFVLLPAAASVAAPVAPAAPVVMGDIKLCVHGAGADVFAEGPVLRVKDLDGGDCVKREVPVGSYDVGVSDVDGDDGCDRTDFDYAKVKRTKHTRKAFSLPLKTTVAAEKTTTVHLYFDCSAPPA